MQVLFGFGILLSAVAFGLIGLSILQDGQVLLGAAVLLVAGATATTATISVLRSARVGVWLGSLWARFTECRPIYGDPNSEAVGQLHSEISGPVSEPASGRAGPDD